MKTYLIVFLLLANFAFGMNLKDKFKEAEVGSYVVTEQNKTYTLLRVHTHTDEELILEEISIPSTQVNNLDWKEWVLDGAPGHTSWILYAIDLDEAAITECYSFTKNIFLPTESMDAFLTTLIKLKLHYLSDEKRIQKGPTARPGEVGTSKPWGPPQYREGKKVKDPSYDVYTTVWPSDDSELSGKNIVLYFDQTQPHFPFPFWMQVREGGIKFKMRAVDSGTLLSPIQKKLPRRAPHFIGGIQHENGNFVFTLSAPLYYTSFKLYAVDTSTSPRLTHSLPIKMARSKETITLSVDEKKLQDLFTHGHQYLWIAVPEDGDQHAESSNPFIW